MIQSELINWLKLLSSIIRDSTTNSEFEGKLI